MCLHTVFWTIVPKSRVSKHINYDHCFHRSDSMITTCSLHVFGNSQYVAVAVVCPGQRRDQHPFISLYKQTEAVPVLSCEIKH